MKLNKLFLMAAMGLGLFACNNNDLVEGSAPNGTQEEGTTYVGFTLKFNDTNSRADGTEAGTEAEQKITRAYVMMTSEDGTTFEKVLDMTAPANGSVEGYYQDNKKFLFQTTAGNHDFYAVINPDEVPTKDGNISDYFNTAKDLPLTTITTNNSFMMSSCEKKTFYVNDNITQTQALDGTANSFTIDVERVAAKVTMTCENTTLTNATNNAGGTITTPKFTLKGGATKSYRMAQSAINEIAGNAWTYTSSETDVYVKTGSETDLHKLATPVYCLENLHNNYYQKNTTYVDIETTFTPAKVVNCLDQLDVNPDNNLKNNSTTGSFFVVRSGEHAQNYLMKSDLLAWQKSKNYVENQSNEISKNPDHFPAGVESISEEYVNGKCFFGPIWIGQETADASTAPVTRNTWYNLKITGIKLPGEPHEPEIDDTGETPLVPPTNVAITLSVMPWNFIDRGINLQ
ncbi:Mfa1 family fimbria major subunit [Phocaeicola barnesiae]|uniref:Mfa1 family fimbria major subunit n=1 Tax=Phocaeicola barnesiae TaxID=376804 RepID=UPI00266F5250|nr:Mfa1 family fimbria major subunit [Phocaeicola barnesiae]